MVDKDGCRTDATVKLITTVKKKYICIFTYWSKSSGVFTLKL